MGERTIYTRSFCWTSGLAGELWILHLITKDAGALPWYTMVLVWLISFELFFANTLPHLFLYSLLTGEKKPWDWFFVPGKRESFDLLRKAGLDCLEKERVEADKLKRWLKISMAVQVGIYGVYLCFFLL